MYVGTCILLFLMLEHTLAIVCVYVCRHILTLTHSLTDTQTHRHTFAAVATHKGAYPAEKFSKSVPLAEFHACMSYEEEDTCVSYDEEDICVI